MKITEIFREEQEKKKTLYISRPLHNAQEFIDWAKEQGFDKVVEAKELHVTVAFSHKKVDWSTIEEQTNSITVKNGKRSIEKLGPKAEAVVLRFECQKLKDRWKELCDLGASWDYDDYHPHITITYDGADIDISNIEPFNGSLILDPEDMHEVEKDWSEKIKEK